MYGSYMDGEKKKMSIIDDYIEKAGSNWLGVKNCPVGTTMTIAGVRLDEESYAKPYIILTGAVPGFEEEMQYRCGVQNLKRLRETFGGNETEWTGKQMECIGHVDYPNIGKGLLWRGVGASAPSAPAGQSMADTVSDIVGKIMLASPEMTAKAVKKLIDKELKDAGGLLNDEAAVRIVAKNLGVELK